MRRPTIDEVIRHLEIDGARIYEAPDLPAGWWGASSRSLGVVYLRRGLNQRQQLAALLHEAAHWGAAHDGHQSRAVEDRIGETVAAIIIDPDEYALAETLVGSNPRLLAAELDVTPGLVEAWQRRRNREYHLPRTVDGARLPL